MTKANSPSSIFPIRVLIVDDHPNTATMLARAVAQLGPKLDVFSATNGKQALEKLNGGAVDILITDMIMPEMNGLELVEKLQNHPAGRPRHVMLITAYDVPGLKETARRLKVNEIIAKPVRPEYICQTLERIMQDWSRNEVEMTEATPREQVFKILVADDLADNVSLVTRYLQNEGYQYCTASDGEQTLQKARAELPDLILLDINMPIKDGFTVLRELREDPAIQHIPVIILTAARIDPGDVQSGLSLGADDYVTKPFDRRELMARIRTKLRVKQAEDVIRRRNRELSLLPQIGKDLSARINVDELATILLKRTVENLGALMGYVVLHSKNGLFQQVYTSAGTTLLEEIPVPHSLLSLARDLQQGFVVENARDDARWQGMPSGQLRSAVVVPLLGRHELLGLLFLAHEREGYFNEEHLLLLQAIASQAAIAVENAQLFATVTREQKRLAAILQSAPDAILMFDTNDCLALINPMGQQLFTDYETWLGLPLARGAGHDTLIGLLEQAQAPGASHVGELEWPDQRVFSTLFTPIEDGGHIITLHDVTRFKELEKIKNEFIATASHDLKNPITAISGFSRLMSQAGPLNEEQTEFVERILSASEQMNGLVQELLQLVQLDMGLPLKHVRVELGLLAAQVADEFQPQASLKGQRLNFQKTATPLHVEGDAGQLAQALRNLVGNAVKYTPEGGSIAIELGVAGEMATLTVSDNGLGIPSADQPHIFKRFYRAHTSETEGIEGTGLGLAIVWSIVNQHHGRVSVSSQPGAGSVFQIFVPRLSENDMAYDSPVMNTVQYAVPGK